MFKAESSIREVETLSFRVELLSFGVELSSFRAELLSFIVESPLLTIIGGLPSLVLKEIV